MKKIVIDNFDSCMKALNFIDELKKKNEKCEGKLTNTPKKVTVVDGKTGKKVVETEYVWHVTYDSALLKVEKNDKRKN